MIQRPNGYRPSVLEVLPRERGAAVVNMIVADAACASRKIDAPGQNVASAGFICRLSRHVVRPRRITSRGVGFA
ncbi:hypothetical protein [Cryobacterium psychrophilum]|uniref:Uncharacterized protein n=1 Tax=Cryobacterium psychrophilum TaxID=41988 RepID=A0A4Y8KM66_9MICO|nr:hypothetical protein [Cryobacterium psychrophilum]TFD78639.1 hypothetical protein E3T53_10720 [Cryobacterium psychrophilum]